MHDELDSQRLYTSTEINDLNDTIVVVLHSFIVGSKMSLEMTNYDIIDLTYSQQTRDAEPMLI